MSFFQRKNSVENVVIIYMSRWLDDRSMIALSLTCRNMIMMRNELIRRLYLASKEQQKMVNIVKEDAKVKIKELKELLTIYSDTYDESGSDAATLAAGDSAWNISQRINCKENEVEATEERYNEIHTQYLFYISKFCWQPLLTRGQKRLYFSRPRAILSVCVKHDTVEAFDLTYARTDKNGKPPFKIDYHDVLLAIDNHCCRVTAALLDKQEFLLTRYRQFFYKALQANDTDLLHLIYPYVENDIQVQLQDYNINGRKGIFNKIYHYDLDKSFLFVVEKYEQYREIMLSEQSLHTAFNKGAFIIFDILMERIGDTITNMPTIDIKEGHNNYPELAMFNGLHERNYSFLNRYKHPIFQLKRYNDLERWKKAVHILIKYNYIHKDTLSTYDIYIDIENDILYSKFDFHNHKLLLYLGLTVDRIIIKNLYLINRSCSSDQIKCSDIYRRILALLLAPGENHIRRVKIYDDSTENKFWQKLDYLVVLSLIRKDEKVFNYIMSHNFISKSYIFVKTVSVKDRKYSIFTYILKFVPNFLTNFPTEKIFITRSCLEMLLGVNDEYIKSLLDRLYKYNKKFWRIAHDEYFNRRHAQLVKI